MLLPGIFLIKDDDSITIRAYPHNPKLDFTLYEKSFKNYCPECETTTSLTLKLGEDDEIFFDPSGTIICDKCKSEYDAVEGYKLDGVFKILTPLPGVKNNNSPTTALKMIKEDLEKIDSYNKPTVVQKSEYKGTLKSPIFNATPGEGLKIKNLIKGDPTYFIDKVKYNIHNNEMELELLNHPKIPKTKYQKVKGKKSKKKLGKNKKLGFKANSKIEKTIMLKGKSLKTVKNIYKWLNKTNGSGNWEYNLYYNHIKGENVHKFGKKSAKHCWNKKAANCVDFAWIFHTMCKGIGVKVEIWKGNATFHGRTMGHFWNKYKGRIFDCATYSAKKYNGKKIV